MEKAAVTFRRAALGNDGGSVLCPRQIDHVGCAAVRPTDAPHLRSDENLSPPQLAARCRWRSSHLVLALVFAIASYDCALTEIREVRLNRSRDVDEEVATASPV